MALTSILLTEKVKRSQRPDGYKGIGEVLYDYYVSIKDKVKSDPSQEIYVHFTEVQKLGFNPKTEHRDTPIGIYGFPLTAVVEKYVKGKIFDIDQRKEIPIVSDIFPYGYYKPIIFLFKVKSDANVLRFGTPIPVSEEREYYDRIDMPNYDRRTATVDPRELYRYIIEHTNLNKEGHTITASSTFLKMGIDGFVDTGYGTIHIAERIQAVFFNPKAVEVVEMLKRGETTSKKRMDTRRSIAEKRKQYIIGVVKSHPKQQLRGKKFQHDPLGLESHPDDVKIPFLQGVDFAGAPHKDVIYVNPVLSDRMDLGVTLRYMGMNYAFLQGLVVYFTSVSMRLDDASSFERNIKGELPKLDDHYYGTIPTGLELLNKNVAYDDGFNIIFVLLDGSGEDISQIFMDVFKNSKHKIGLLIADSGEIIEIT